MKKFGLPKSRRIRSASEFARIYDLNRRAGDRCLLVFAAENDLGISRFGVSVSRKHGNAVKRAKLKRLLREAFRLTAPELPDGLDLILIPRLNSAAELMDYQQSLKTLVDKLAERLEAGQSP